MSGGSSLTGKFHVRTIAILVGVLVVCAISYLAASKAAELSNPEEESSSSLLLSISEESITAISWNYDGESFELVNEDDTWKDSADPDGSVDQTAAGELASILAETETVTSYSIDGAELSELDVENLLEALEEMQSEGEGSAESAIGTSPEICFTFHRNTEDFSEMTLEFVQYDNNFYLVSFNGEQRLLGNRNDVADLSELISTWRENKIYCPRKGEQTSEAWLMRKRQLRKTPCARGRS